MSKYIVPPDGDMCEWRKGRPPSIGWWPASRTRDAGWLRYWNGACWSVGDSHRRDAEHVAKDARVLDREPSILWTDKWWEQP